ncbi:sugar ABC transporter substrate-binding protein [Microbacterium tenebrionis]|uniref:sugar ABC transporter substrate-binding protein n=1 Tax=Microbacterium tenebrionis TaxID=2830665 RepID=UPI0015885589|nr:sugar ABC transporter substrate-binding protein [Microbacterium ihumii]
MRTTNRKRRLSAVALTIATVAALAGCSVTTGAANNGQSAEGKTDGMGDDGVFKVAAFTAGYATPGGKLTLDAFVDEGNAQENWEVTLYTSAFDYDKINSDIQTAIQQGADVILAGFPDPRQIAPLVQAAKEADIPIFSIDGGVEPNDDFVVDITFNQDQIADLTVGALEEAMGGLEGKNVMVIGHDPHVGIQTRSNLALDKLEAAGAIIAGGDMKQALDPGTGRTEALNFVTDYLQANPEGLDGVWVGWDDAALGAARAITEAGRDDIYVTGVDALGETAVEIAKDGPMYASVAQDWIKVVDQMIGLMNDYRDSATLPDTNFIPLDGELIDRSNVATYEPTL